MKYLKEYESWRHTKSYFMIPLMILEKILSLLINYIPFIKFTYDELSANVDIGKAIIPNKMPDIKEILLNDIKNNAIRRTLKATGLFSNWKLYYTKTSEDKDKIYISKDNLKKDDVCFFERLHIKDDSIIFVVAALKTSKHDEMRKERHDSLNKKRMKELEKLVKDVIKNKTYMHPAEKIIGDWNNDPVLFKIVRANRIDLFKKIINKISEIGSEKEVKDIVSLKINGNGYYTSYTYGIDILSQSQSKEMTDLIMSILYTPEELEKMEIEKNIEKYNL